MKITNIIKISYRLLKVRDSFHGKSQTYIRLYFGTLLIAALFALLTINGISLLSPEMKELVEIVEEDWYINTFFDNINKEKGIKETKDICIIAISDDISTRGNIARLLGRLADKEPHVIGLDIMFRGTANSDSIQSVALLDTLKNICNKKHTRIVIPISKNRGGLVYPYFTDSLIKYSDCFNMGIVSQDNLDLVNFKPYDEFGCAKFSTRIAELVIGHSLKESKEFIINYRKKGWDNDGDNIEIETVGSIDSCLDSTDLYGKIVIVGSTTEEYDLKDFPFEVNDGCNQISGTELIAYETNTILAPYLQYERKYNYPYNKMPISFCHALLILSLISFYFFLFCIIEKYVIERFTSVWLEIFIKPILLILGEIFIINICFFITRNLMVVPSVVYIMTCLAFIEPAYKISIKVLHKNKKL